MPDAGAEADRPAPPMVFGQVPELGAWGEPRGDRTSPAGGRGPEESPGLPTGAAACLPVTEKSLFSA